MILDPRIKEGKRPLTCLDVDQAQQFVGKECIFSDSFINYKNIQLYTENPQYIGILSIEDKFKYNCKEESPFINKTDGYCYDLVLPLEWINESEKKYRPYTIKDFEKAFLNDEFDDFIIFRDKHNPDDIYTMRYNGNFKKGQFEYICLGAKNFSFESLFENYEIADYDGDWQPFGVIDEQK